MPRNPYISHGTTSEQNLLSDLIAEAIKIYGHDVYYIPRKIVKLDGILNEDVISEFPNAFMTEMYVESVDGFEGDGKLITKFGLEIRDQITLVVSVRRWNQLVGRFGYPEEQVRPNEGDLIFHPMTNGLFEIKFVEDKKPFFQLNSTPTYKLICELYEYPSQNKFNTGVEEIDDIQTYSSNGFSVLIDYGIGNEKFVAKDDAILTFIDSSTGSCKILSVEETEDSNIDKVFIGPVTFDSGEYKTLTDGILFNHSIKDVSGVVTYVFDIANSTDADTFKNDDSTQNNDFEIEGNMFIDFSEANPFGEINF